MADIFDVLLNVSPVSACVWFAVGALPWLRGLRTAPEKAFVVASVIVGLSSLADWTFFLSPDPQTALVAARIRMSLLSLAAMAFFYFGLWLARPRSRLDVIPTLPVAGGIIVAWTLATTGVRYEAAARGWWLVRDPFWFAVFQAQVGLYGFLAIYFIAWTLRHSTFASDVTRRRLASILWILTGGWAIWFVSTVYSVLYPVPGPPLTSPVALISGLLLLVGLVRVDPERFRTLMRRILVTPARPSIAILYHNSGRPLAEVRLPGAKGIDEAALSDVAAAVDHVLTAGLKSEAGGLRQMRHGDHHIIFERGDFITLVVVSQGPPSEGLRSEMRTAAKISDRALAALDEVLRPSGI